MEMNPNAEHSLLERLSIWLSNWFMAR